MSAAVPELRRALRVHAMAARLMGVDFVPMSSLAPLQAGIATSSVQPQHQAAPTRAPITNTAPVQRTAPAPRAATAAPMSSKAANVHTTPRSPGQPALTLYQPAAADYFVPKPGVLFDEQPVADPSSATPSDAPRALASSAATVEFKPLPKLDRAQAERWLSRLRDRYEADAPHSKFVTDHHSIVFGEGDPLARLMFVGEAPGAEEDRLGRPFVGRSGQLLDKMIAGMGLSREQVYIANVLKTRPPNNATPTFEEAAACAPYLFEQIAIIRPEAIVTLGLPATRLLLNTTASMSNLRGRWSPFVIPARLPHPETRPAGERPVVPIMPTFHPAFVLRAYTKENRQKVWSDLLHVVTRLGLPKPSKSAE